MNKKETQKRIEALKKEIRHHAYLYHVQDTQEISDAAWDSLKHELAALEAKYPEFITADSPTQRVSGTPLEKFTKVEHRVRQWSLHDAFDEQELRDWETRNSKILEKHDGRIKKSDIGYVCELKIDGLHIVLTYEQGELVTAATRGDGAFGEDVTQNIKTIESVPLALREKTSCVVEGEIWMPKKEFERLNKETEKSGKPRFANPRNATAGAIRQLDARVTASRKLESFFYDIVWPDTLIPETQHEELAWLRSAGFKSEPHAKYCAGIEDVLRFLHAWEKRHDHLPYLVDGVVIKVDGRRFQELLGYTGKAPRFALAFKFAPEEATTVLKGITVQVGRLGRLTPVAELDPVFVAGSTVSRATLHNQKRIDELDVRIGDTIVVRKAGDIIPEVVSVLKRMRPRDAKPFTMPRRCPVCGSSVVVKRSGDSILHYCTDKKCTAKNALHITHFVSKRAFGVEGLGGKIVERLLDEGLIRDAADIFTLQKGDLEVLEGFGEKSAENLLASVEQAKTITLPKLINAFGIEHVGERMAQHVADFIAAHAKSEKELWRVLSHLHEPAYNLESIEDVGEETANSIRAWSVDERNQGLLKKLQDVGISVSIPKGAARRDDGAVFVFTGTLQTVGRDEAKDLVIESGGTVGSTISKNTTYLVAGENPGSKYKKAVALGVKIIDEKEFLRLIAFIG